MQAIRDAAILAVLGLVLATVRVDTAPSATAWVDPPTRADLAGQLLSPEDAIEPAAPDSRDGAATMPAVEVPANPLAEPSVERFRCIERLEASESIRASRPAAAPTAAARHQPACA